MEALPPTGVATIAPRLIVVDPEGPTCPEAPEVPQTQLVGPTTAVDVAKRSRLPDTPEAGAERRPAVQPATGKPQPKRRIVPTPVRLPTFDSIASAGGDAEAFGGDDAISLGSQDTFIDSSDMPQGVTSDFEQNERQVLHHAFDNRRWWKWLSFVTQTLPEPEWNMEGFTTQHMRMLAKQFEYIGSPDDYDEADLPTQWETAQLDPRGEEAGWVFAAHKTEQEYWEGA